jgi:hypothetical protein
MVDLQARHMYFADHIQRSGVSKMRNIDGDTFAFKKKFCGDATVCMTNEIIFSKLAKQLNVRAVENTEACFRSVRGVVSKWFLSGNENLELFGYDPTSCIPPECFQGINLRAAAKQYQKQNTHADFTKNLVETYLHSVLIMNADHKVTYDFHTSKLLCANIYTTRDANGQINMAPYHDMEASAYTNHIMKKARQYDPEYITKGYKSNLPALRKNFKQIHDNYLDKLNGISLISLCPNNFELSAKLGNQIKFMKDFKSI